MKRVIGLAAAGRGFVEPNPMVGAIVLDGMGQLVGEGYHAKFGGPHGEVVALAMAGEKARGGTLYVTLEPCCHHGKTPPCTDAIIKAGIARVVAGCPDPNPNVPGGGVALLGGAVLGGGRRGGGVLGEREAEREREEGGGHAVGPVSRARE